MSEDLTPRLQDTRKRRLLAQLMKQRGLASASERAIGPRPDPSEAPLSLAQQRLWFLDQLEPGGIRYNVFATLALRGTLDEAALEHSLTEILRRHETLRATFRQVGGKPQQRIAPPGRFPLVHLDLGDIAEAARPAELRRLALVEARRPFDLSGGPLARGTLVRLGPEESTLLLGMHHIVSDGWSVAALVSELAAHYTAHREGRPCPLPEPPIQYADFAAWQRDWLTGEVLEAELAYWRRRLDGLEALDLPTDRPRPPVQSFAGAVQSKELPPGLLDDLRALGQEHDATLFMSLLAGLQALLHRYSGQVDVVVGAPIANRSRAEIESLIGFFTNTLVLRTDLSGDPTFRELLGRVREVALGAYDHPDLPFEKLVEELRPERDLSRNPLFGVAFALQGALEEPIRVPGLRIDLGSVDNHVAKFDLTVYVTETDPGLLSFEYNTDLFDDATVGRALGHLEKLLAAAAADPELRVSELPLLSDTEERRLLLEWNETGLDDPSEKTVLDLFEERAAATPDAVAVTSGGDSLSYGELDRRSNRLARHLRTLGVGPEVLVGVCLERSWELVTGLLGILKAGGAYLPLDPEYPKTRLRLMLEDASVPVLLSQQSLLAALPEQVSQVVCLDRDAQALAAHSDAPLERETGTEALAYVIYTSGSSGRPKGVEVPHAGLVNLARWHVGAYGVAPEDRATLIASIAFDASAWEIWPYLIAGASLHVPDDETRLLPRRLATWLNRQHITHSFIMTPLAESLLSEPGLEELRLRYLLTGGDKLHRSAVESLPCAVVNHYGPTEYSVVTTAGGVEAGESGDPSIGRPISNTRVYVLNEALTPVPQGVAGELFIAGSGLARGYLKRPELTAERFVPDPFSSKPEGGRLYRTGDLVRYRADGSLDFLGRVDSQVKLRGYRIEVGEIESALEGHPQVERAAVTAREDEPGEKRLAAYVVGRAGSSVTPGELRDHLARMLPGYMVPSAFVLVPSLPLSPNGKVDHRALPAPSAADQETDYEPPRTRAEAAMAQIWAEVLRLERVGIRDNFFDLGGDSILSIQIVARANEAGLRLTPKQVFQHQTVAELASVVGTEGAVSAEQGVVLGEAPLTPIQHWFFEEGLEEAHHFNQAALLELSGDVPANLLEQAAQELQTHHDALRLRFRRVEGRWVQEFSGEECGVPFSRVDLSAVGDDDLPSAVTRAADDAQRSLDLASGPVWRMVSIDPGRGRPGRVLLVAHHLVVDGVSWRVLLEDLETVGGQLLAGERVALPPKTSSYRAWSERLNSHASSGGFAAERDRWRGASSAGAGSLPRDLGGGDETLTVGSSAVVSVALDEEATRALLQDVPAAYRTRIDEVLLTALGLAMREWTGGETLLLDLESHGREELFDEIDLSRTVGWFTAIHPVRLELPEGGGLAAALKAVKEQLRAVPHRGVGYGALRYLKGDEALPEMPTPPLSFNYLGQFDQVLSEGGLFRPGRESSGLPVSPRSRRSHLLDVTGSIAGGRLRMELTYGESVHRRETVEALGRGFEAELRRLIDHCRSNEARGYTPSDFSLAHLDQAALDRVVADDREVEDVYPLSPMQQGLLFHTLLDPGVGVYVEQLRLDFQGELDAVAWRRAWERVVERHPILRTRFAWDGLEAPHQAVLPRVDLPWEEWDWSGLGEAERQQRLEALLAEDHRAGFDPGRAPLLRLKLIRTKRDAYTFSWNFHHILLDGWCLPLLLNEVIACYRAFSTGQQPDLPPAPRFREYVGWLAEQDRGQAETYWRSALQGLSEANVLPFDTRAGAEGEADFGEQSFGLSPEVTARLRELARRHRLTLNTFVLGAWALLLSRYTNESDVVFGSTVSGRPSEIPHVESMVGLFVNTLPLRARVEGDHRLLPWLAQLQAQQVDMREHDFVPLVDIRSWSDVPAGQPLFETILGFQNYPLEAKRADLGPVSLQGGRIRERTHYPLTLMVQPGPSLGFRALHDRRRVPDDQTTRMFGHLRSLLEGMAADPERRLRELPLLTAAEHNRAVVEWNANDRSYPAEASIHVLFEEQARRQPEAPAVRDHTGELSYGELDRRASGLARRLSALGVGSEVRVGVCMTRSAEMVVAFLGILKAGGAYVPLDPTYPRERLAFMVEDARVSVVLSEATLRGELPEDVARIVELPLPEEELSETEAPPAVAAAEGLAYVIYTSGSTGTPKGVAVTHQAVIRLVRNTDYVQLDPTDRIAQASNASFDAATFELWGALLSGASLIVVDRDTVLSPESLAEAIEREGITTLFLTTALFNQVAENVPSAFSPLRYLLFGGEAVEPRWVREVLERGAPRHLLHVYGPTENTTFSTWHPINTVPGDARTVPIGRAIANSLAVVLDRDLNPVPVGVVGELYVGGDGLARAYLNRPRLTAERFVPHPFPRVPGERLYRTGDLVRCGVDGSVEFLGRNDHQVKIRGFRVELGEIEAALSEAPSVREALVQARDGGAGGGKRLVAFVVPGAAEGGGRDDRVARWRDVYDSVIYEDLERDGDERPTVNLAGWSSSYTGLPIPPDEMEEQIDQTVNRILEGRPRRVLEIGCGTGLLLYRVAPHCDAYVGTDFSKVALEYVRSHLRSLDQEPSGIDLRQQPADDFSGIAPGSFDAVVLNSVIQYFPDPDYLLAVLEGAVRALAPGGRVVVGDVRHLPLLRAFATSVQVHRSAPSTPKTHLREQVREHLAQEQELVVDPALFQALRRRIPALGRVRVLPKRGRARNELTQYRYDAILEVGTQPEEPPPVRWLDPSEDPWSLDRLRELARKSDGQPVGVRLVPNARVLEDVQTARWLDSDDDTPRENGNGRGLEPEDVWALGDTLGVPVEISWASGSADGAFDVVFGSRGGVVRDAGDDGRPWARYTNQPLRGTEARGLVPKLRGELQERLPDYMVPSAFVVLEQIPLTPNGKVDQRALERVELSRPELEETFTAPRTPMEESVAAVWRDVLDLDRVGVHDDFFTIGGHSLLATQVVSRVREVFKVDLPLRDLFEAPTVAGLSERVSAARQRDRRPAPPLKRALRTGRLPASFAQQRLWVLDQLQPGGTAYNMCRARRLVGPLDPATLERSLAEIVRRHETLRTTFVDVEGVPWQRIAEPPALQVPVIDLEVLPEDDREAEARRRATEEALRPYDLGDGPLFRTLLLRLSPEEHVLVLSIHHIVCDGWSLDVLERELAAVYAAFLEGRPSPLPELAVQYVDFAVWQRDWLSGDVLAGQLDYWKERLGSPPPALALPSDRPRPSVQTQRGAAELLVLPPPLAAALRTLSRARGATLFMTLLAGFKALLSRMSGQDDIVVGTPIANRGRVETERIVGFFVNTLVLRSDLSGDPRFSQLLESVKAAALGAYDNQDLPFERLVEALHPERDLGRTPLFQVFFNMISFVSEPPSLPGLTVRDFDLQAETAKFDLTLYAAESEAGLVAALNYNADLFDAATIREMLDQFRLLLETVATDPDRRLSTLPPGTAPSAPDREEPKPEPASAVAAQLPDPREPLEETPHEPVAVLFERWAERAPQAVALRQGGLSLSYGELAERARDLARRLAADGLGRGEVVALDAEPGFGLMVAFFGVWLAGGVVLPLDRRLPVERRKLLCREARAKRLIQTERPTDASHWTSTLALPVITLETSVQAGRGAVALPRLDGRDAAYVFFTSGTTGSPKGVLGTHGGLSHFVSWQRRTFDVGPGDRSSQLTSLSFDVVLREMFLPLTSGATLCMPPDPTELGPDRVLPWLEEEGVSILHTVPTLAQAWLRDDPVGVSLPALRCLFFAGEPLPASFVRRWREAFSGDGTIVNLYGPTETTLAKCFHVVPPDPGEGVVPVGRPLPETQALVLADDGRRCGAGEWGEIVIRTPHRTLGYVNVPEENRRRFVPNPFRDDEGDLVYLTGDRGRHRADGVLEIGGRLDDQVKVRGVRIELREVETALAEHPAVRQAAVVAREEPTGGKCLVAFVTPGEAGAPRFEELRSFLKLTLPDSHIPAAFAVLDTLPVTANGKLDRGALPHDVAEVGRSEIPIAPRSPMELELAAIWREILDVEDLGVHEDFFRLGGHSLLATQVMSRVRAAFRTELPLRALFEAPTIAALARAVAAAQREGGSLAAAPIRPAPADDRRELSFAQQRLWFLERLDPGRSPYRFSAGLRLTGELHVTALARALDEIVARHETLRTRITESDGRAEQIACDTSEADFVFTDLSDDPQAGEKERWREVASEEADAEFDLAAGRVFRARLLRLAPQDHVLLLSMHHVVSDIWSGGVLVRELSALYPAFRDGRRSPLAPLPIQYADYAHWQREWLSGEVLEEQVGYWRRQLDGVSPLQLPTDRPRPAEVTYNGAREMRVLPLELTGGLRELGRREGATLFMVLLAGFQALLARYTGQDDVAVGTPIANRNRAETEGLIGFLVNSLVMRVDLAGDPSVEELVRRVKEVALQAYDHQDLPFEKLVSELQPQRDRGRNPLFQVMFALQNAPFEPLELPGLTLAPIHLEATRTHFEIELFAWEATSGLVLALGYNTDLLDAQTARRLLGHYEALLKGWLARPSAPASSVPLLSEAEKSRLLVEWNATGVEHPPGRTVLDLFAGRAAATPDAAAVTSGGTSMSYAELDRRSNLLARHLVNLGVGAETRVGVCLERSPELVVSLLGILKSGGAYLPLDPAYPKDRLRFMLEDASVPVLLSEERLLEALPEHGAHVVCLDRDAPAMEAQEDAALESDVDPDHLAYVIYTSGSTGTPKGVQIPHRGLLNLADWHVRTYGVGPGDRATLIASPAFDASVWELWPYLIAGASLHIPDEETRSQPDRLATWLARQEITHCFLMTPLAEAVLSEGRLEGSLRFLLTGGDKLHRSALEGLPCPLFNHYGPTEVSVVTTAGPVAEGAAEDPPIGRPVSNTRVYVLDATGHPTPQGVAGELHIAGDGLARGYLDRPGLTAEYFRPDPFSPLPGGRLYRTGDQVRWRSDGSLEFLGRVDHQVKLRGFRIELGEIESALAGHEAVGEVAVLVREAEPGRKHLVAYVALRAGSEATASELRQHLGRTLPAHMVPGPFVFLESLPLSPNGKVDRRALPAPDAADRETPFEAPRDRTEAVLARIWSEVLRIERVGIHDNFFHLGGDSILSLQIASRAKAAGLGLHLKQIFEHQTVAELAEHLGEAGGDGVEGAPIRPVPRDGDLELSFAQERLWLVDRLHPGGWAYNLSGALELTGRLNVSALERSLAEVVRRHDSLRTVIAESAGRPVQRVEPDVELTLPVDELSGATEAEREHQARRMAEDESRTAFDLESGPLFRVRLLRLSEQRHVLLVGIHHVVADGWSLNVLARELGALYAAFSMDRPSPLSEPPIQYADYASWQRQRLGQGALHEQLEYWRRQLDGYEQLHLPTDRARPSVQTFAGATESTWLSEELTSEVRSLCQDRGVTTFMVLLAGFKALLHRYTGQADIVVGTPIVNRSRPETEDLIGLFLNAIVLRTNVGGDPSFLELLERVRDMALGAYAHPDVPFEQLVEELAPRRDLSRTPLFQVLFNMLSFELKPLDLPGLTLSPFNIENASAKHDLTLHALEAGGRIGLTLGYNSDLFEAETVRSLLDSYGALLRAAVREGRRRLSSLPLASSPAERRPPSVGSRVRALGTFVPFTPGDVEQSVAGRFERQVSDRGEWPAISTAEGEWSYTELNRTANRIAHGLRERARGEPGRVGLLLSHDAPLMAALLGVVKSGGVFVPLDPRFPGQRLDAMARDGELATILTDDPALARGLTGPGAVVGVEEVAQGESDENPDWTVKADDLAYLLYTSGSTGTPKGVTQSHRNLLHHIRSYTHALRIGPQDRLSLLASVSFDAALMDIFGALLNGATLVPIDIRREGLDRGLIDRLAEKRVTVYHSTPTVFRRLLESGAPEGAFGGVRAVVLGGEAALRRDVELFKRHFAPGSVLLNNMGPTESSVTLHHLLEHEAPFDRERVPIGHPVEETEVVLLDPSGRPTEVYGELAIRSRYVTPGYWRRPELTRAAFVGEPDEAGRRLYRTGDYARRLPDGSFDYLGRRDSQVKIRGFRVELGDVEAALARHPEVTEAAARTWEEEDGEVTVAAYVVVRAQPGPTDRELRRFLMESVPDYMVPADLVRLDALPLTPTRKIDRQALLRPVAAVREEEGYVAPRSPLEESLSTIWQEVLRLDRVGVHDNFFELGGNSLRATQVTSRIRQSLGVELPLRWMFEAATLGELAEAVQKEQVAEGRRAPVTRIARGSARAALESREASDVGH